MLGKGAGSGRRMSGSRCCCACDKENRQQPETCRPVCFLLVQIITFQQPGGTRTKHHGRVTFLAGRCLCVLCSHLMRLLRYIEIPDRYRNISFRYCLLFLGVKIVLTLCR